MANQPVLDKKSSSCAPIRYKLLHAKNYEIPNDPRHDESHIHGYYEIYFNISGSVSFWANNKLYPIKSGDMIVTKPGDFHFCVYHAPSVHEHFCLCTCNLVYIQCLSATGNPLFQVVVGKAAFCAVVQTAVSAVKLQYRL